MAKIGERFPVVKAVATSWAYPIWFAMTWRRNGNGSASQPAPRLCRLANVFSRTVRYGPTISVEPVPLVPAPSSSGNREIVNPVWAAGKPGRAAPERIEFSVAE